MAITKIVGQSWRSILNFEILNLRERPEFIETCAAWVYGEWGCQHEDSSFEKVLSYLKNAGQDNDLLECWVAVEGERPLAMACLKRVEHPDRMDLSPWLGSVYVYPLFRKKNIAHALCGFLEKEIAQTYQYSECYLQTAIPEFYEQQGWDVIGRVRDTMGLDAVDRFLMKKSLCAL